MRMIDADKFILSLMDASLSSVDEDTILDLVDSVPTADAVPVVRCRECKNWLPAGYKSIADPQNPQCGGRCWYSNVARFENDFCSYGERKEGAGGEST